MELVGSGPARPNLHLTRGMQLTWGTPPSGRTVDARARRWPRKRAVTLSLRLALALALLLATLMTDVGTASSHAPHDQVADIAVSPAYAKDQTVLAIVRGKLMRATDGGRTWTEIVRGLGGETERLARLAIAPSDARIAYMTTPGDGVLRSADGGTSWQAAGRGLANLRLHEIAVSPASPDIVLAGGGLDEGLFLTTDGGVSWSTVDDFGRVTSLAFRPDGRGLLVGDGRGRLATSTDRGETWDTVLTLEQGDAVSAIATGAASGPTDVVFAATTSGRLLRSDYGGTSFTPVGDGLPEESVQSLELSPRYERDATLWASTRQSGVFRSTDEGETWEPMTNGLTTDAQADEHGLAQFGSLAAGVEESGDTTLFVGGFDGFFRYDDRRSAWQPVETLADHIVGVAVSPDFANDRTVAVTTYIKGAFVSRDGGGTWELANDGLTLDDVGAGNKFAPLWRLHNVVFSPDFANDGTIFSATWVRIVKSSDRGASWREVTVSPPPSDDHLRQFVLAVSPTFASDQTLFAATRQGEIFRSERAGEADTWTRVSRLGERVRSLAVAPEGASDRVLYAGTVVGVYASTDGGRTWKEAGPRMEAAAEGRETDAGAQVAISPAHGADGTAFAGTDSGLFVTRDAGRSWTEITASPLTASSQIEAIAVSPDYEHDRTVLVSTRELGLLRSTDGGSTFQAVGAELLDSNHLVADFSNPTSAPIQFSPTFATDRTIFAYAQADLVRSTDGGDSWEVLTLPSGADVLESLEFTPGESSGPAARDGQRWFDTPIGHLSARRVLAATAVALVAFAALRALGVGGRRTRRALAVHVGSGVAVLAVALVVLAA
jgi:photosystem II stability/assembly factor-like uncharacterized protein